MRLKLIAVFSLIVLVLGGLFLAVSIYAGSAPVDAQQAPRALEAATVELEVEGMAAERWLSVQAKDPTVREPFGISDKVADAQGNKATEVCNSLRAKAQTDARAAEQLQNEARLREQAQQEVQRLTATEEYLTMCIAVAKAVQD